MCTDFTGLYSRVIDFWESLSRTVNGPGTEGDLGIGPGHGTLAWTRPLFVKWTDLP